MKLFVIDNNETKIYLRKIANTRFELANKIGGTKFTLRGRRYSVNDVKAEAESSDTAAGAILGGLIGLIGGPIGVLTGTTIGGLIGNSSESEENKQVRTFNRSRV